MNKVFNALTHLFRVSLSAALAVVIVLSGLMLCCQVGLTSVRGAAAKAKSCCHLSLAEQIKGKAQKACTCCGISKNVFNVGQETIKAVRALSLADLDLVVLNDSFLRFLHVNTVVATSHGPPRTNSRVPLYIQHSNLRL